MEAWKKGIMSVRTPPTPNKKARTSRRQSLRAAQGWKQSRQLKLEARAEV